MTADSDPAEEDDVHTPDEVVEEDDEGTGIPWMPLVIYLTGVLFYGLWITDGNLYARIPNRQLGWLFLPVFLYPAVGSVATGRAPLRGAPIRRETRPVYFWSVVGIYFGCALAMLALGLGFRD